MQAPFCIQCFKTITWPLVSPFCAKAMIVLIVKPFNVSAQVFEKGNFAGLEEMKKSERLFNKVAPMGVNDIMMAVQYRHTSLPPLALPITSFDGLADGTIDRGNMEQWAQYTSGKFTNVPIQGDHYFVSSRYREVLHLCKLQLYKECAIERQRNSVQNSAIPHL